MGSSEQATPYQISSNQATDHIYVNRKLSVQIRFVSKFDLIDLTVALSRGISSSINIILKGSSSNFKLFGPIQYCFAIMYREALLLRGKSKETSPLPYIDR